MVSEASFNNVRSEWMRELREQAPGAEVLLVGTKADLRGKETATVEVGHRSTY